MVYQPSNDQSISLTGATKRKLKKSLCHQNATDEKQFINLGGDRCSIVHLGRER